MLSRSIARSFSASSRSFFPSSIRACVPYRPSRYYASAEDLPPHIPLGMPALSPTMTKGNLVKWLKTPGEPVSVGDALADIETDKAATKWDSIDDGFFVKAFIEEGTEGVEVGRVIALLVEEEEDIDKFDNYVPPSSADEESVETKAEPEPEPTPEPVKENNAQSSSKAAPKKTGRIAASPAARSLAADLGIDLATVEGSGPKGRIIVSDIENMKGSKASAPSVKTVTFDAPTPAAVSSDADYEDIPNSTIRKVIASRLTESKQQIPHYYLTVDFCVDKLQDVRSKLNSQGNGSYKLSVNDFVIKASAMAMRKVPEVNATWSEKAIRRYNNVNINVAVNSDAGLFTPLVPNTDNKGLVEISTSVKSLAEKAQDGKLSPKEMEIGTFTISNLGMFGIKQFAAVINPPQACILAVGGIETRAVPDGEGWKAAKYMTCTLSCDHRVVDGALGATWLKEFKSRMEDPITLLL